MIYLSQFPSAENMSDAARAAPRSAHRLPFAGRLGSIAKWVRISIETMADYYAAAAIYEQLHRLSDAELSRRGLSRTDLARHVVAARERAARPD